MGLPGGTVRARPVISGAAGVLLLLLRHDGGRNCRDPRSRPFANVARNAGPNEPAWRHRSDLGSVHRRFGDRVRPAGSARLPVVPRPAAGVDSAMGQAESTRTLETRRSVAGGKAQVQP